MEPTGEEVEVEPRSRTRAVLAWALWLVAFGCCAAGLLVTLAIYRPLTVGVLVEGAGRGHRGPELGTRDRAGVTLPALLLPNGHLRSRRWRLVVITSVTGLVLVTVAGPLSPGPLEEMGVDNPFGLTGPAGTAAPGRRRPRSSRARTRARSED